MRIISITIALVILVFGLSFSILNPNQTTINYYFGSLDISLSLLLVFALGVGLLLGFFLTSFSWFKLKCENRSLRNQVKRLSQ